MFLFLHVHCDLLLKIRHLKKLSLPVFSNWLCARKTFINLQCLSLGISRGGDWRSSQVFSGHVFLRAACCFFIPLLYVALAVLVPGPVISRLVISRSVVSLQLSPAYNTFPWAKLGKNQTSFSGSPRHMTVLQIRSVLFPAIWERSLGAGRLLSPDHATRVEGGQTKVE